LAHRSYLDETVPKGGSPITLVGTVMGTPDFMAPEQFEGTTVTPATDIYAFGVVLYEMVTARLPFEASTPVAAAVRRAKPPAPVSSIQAGVPHRWETVIEKCLQFEPAQRYQSATELAAALQRSSTITAGLRTLMANRPRRRQLGVVMACLALLFATVVGFKWYRASHLHRVPEVAQRFYREATEAFRNGSYLTATRQLQVALNADHDFVLAHARLADAFNELDMTGEAQREVNQIKEELVDQLSSAEQTYVNAVRETIRPDLNGALKDYQNLLAAADSAPERSGAMVDLARTEERAGKISDAMKHYAQAIGLDPYSPTPYLRKGILESRRGGQQEADEDFAKAEKIYGTNINLEGTAEVSYQRSYVASKLGALHEAEARKFFQDSLDAAEKMQSAALRVRALSRLSAIEYGTQNDEKAGEVAENAIRLAEENGVPYWATDARVRLGNSWIFRDTNRAKEILQRARREAQRNQWPRLLAVSQMSLAALFVDEQRLQPQKEVITLASPAYDYYRTFGFAQESFQCEILLSRSEAFLGLFTESLRHATKALDLANALATPLELLQAHEAMGNTLFSQEGYPSALDHLESAFRLAAGMSADYLSEEASLTAQALCRMGRFEEAKLAVAQVPESTWKGGSRAKLRFLLFQAELLKSQGRYKEALPVAERALREGAEATGQNWEFELIAAESLARTGKTRKALALCDEMLPGGEQSPVIVAQAKLVKARGLLEMRQWQPARSLAEDAKAFFAVSGQKESELVSLSLLARSYRGIGSVIEAKAATQKMQDMLSDFEHNYGTGGYRLFVKRSGIAEMVSGGGREQIGGAAVSPNGMERKTQ
jgi:tetratricopeptide (TPR) repeat protein